MMVSTAKMSSSETTSPGPQRIPRLTRNREALTSAERWTAITTRDSTINSFVYAVLTTKIYCRPSCPARLARRANVRFYDTPSQAEQAGFRPCKRCKPSSSDQTAVQSNPQIAMVQRACEDIRGQLAAGVKPRLGEVAARAGLTASHFHRVFKKRVGVTPGQYAADLVRGRVRLSDGGLVSDDGTLSELETPPLDWDAGQSLALSGDLSAPVIVDVDDGWNEFDLLLAEEQREISSLEPVSIDPRLISVE